MCGWLGGSATSGDVLKELAAGPDARRFATLRCALADLFPGLRPHQLPTAAQLSMKLGSVRGRIAGNACIEQGQRTYKGVRWKVRNVKPIKEVA